MRIRRLSSLLLAGPIAIVFGMGIASASNGVIDWPTYLRAGPSRSFGVLQELARGNTVEIVGCGEQWCSVQIGRATGYVEQNDLLQEAPPPSANGTDGAASCFPSQRAGYAGGETFRYCPR